MLFVLLANACKPDMVLVSICVEYNLSESESKWNDLRSLTLSVTFSFSGLLLSDSEALVWSASEGYIDGLV